MRMKNWMRLGRSGTQIEDYDVNAELPSTQWIQNTKLQINKNIETSFRAWLTAWNSQRHDASMYSCTREIREKTEGEEFFSPNLIESHLRKSSAIAHFRFGKYPTGSDISENRKTHITASEDGIQSVHIRI